MTVSSTREVQAPDRSVALLVTAAGLVLVVVVAVVTLGLQRPPALPSIGDEPAPAPSGAVAWTTWRDDVTCIDVAEPDGRVHEVWCSSTGAELIDWTDDGALRVSDWSGHQQRTLVVEPTTGEIVRTEPDPHGEAAQERWSREPEVFGHRSDGALVVERPAGTPIWRVDSPETYQLRAGSVSPDGRWIAAVDSADRLVLLATDGSAPARVWAHGVDTHAPPLWRAG